MFPHHSLPTCIPQTQRGPSLNQHDHFMYAHAEIKTHTVCTIAVRKEIGTCPSTTSLYSLEAGAPKLTMLHRKINERKEYTYNYSYIDISSLTVNSNLWLKL